MTNSWSLLARPTLVVRKNVVVLDYGSGNIRSAERAVARAGADVAVTTDARHATDDYGLVVPGVGAFAACMAGLVAVGGPEIIAKRRTSGRPTLAICVGHQVLFEAWIEHVVRTEGCGIWPVLVEQLHAVRLPHMGWNTIQAANGSQLFAGIESDRFYFVHSYGVRALPAAPERRITWAEHGGDRFVAAVEEGPLWSTQFHPEKSGDAGARLIANWVETF